MSVSRFGVSLEENLLKALDAFVKENKYPNRSQAIRALIEKSLVEKKWQCNNVVAGAIIIVYDHHKRDITAKSNDIQHDYHDVILSVQHFHLSHNICLEIIAIKGIANRLTELSDKILAIKGVSHGKMVMSRAE
ncbi:MAG: nickel-responsive transcriptional regulator NikR [Bacteroidales bacterium]|nr:nickel-responsive transcriptional regulator NikR [Bacteroidales bacterium]